ncbi:MAG: hypothetical protein WBD40_00195 [Tepidisphaeraceae bacterium]
MKKLTMVRSAMLAFGAALLFGGAAVPSAQAWDQHYCVLAQAGPGGTCYSSGLHSLYYNYASTTSYSQNVCEYMWNNQNGVVRGGWVGCGWGETSRTWNRTGDAWYNARAYNNMGYAILLSAYTST